MSKLKMFSNFALAAALAVSPAAGGLFASPAMAEPAVELYGSTFTIEEAVNDAIAAEIKKQEGDIENMDELAFVLNGVGNEDLARICTLYPNMTSLEIESEAVTNLAPLAKLRKLTSLELDVNAADFSPLAGLTALTSIDAQSKAMGPDLAWMSGMNKLESISLYSEKPLSLKGLPSLPELTVMSIHGAVINDLSPLVEAMPALITLDLTGTALSDLTPLARLENLKDLSLYGAKLKDFSPLAACPKLESLTYYGTEDADYATLGKLTQIVKLNGGLTKLDNISWVANLPNLREFDVFAEYVTDYSPLAQTKVETFQIWNMRVPVGDLGELGKVASLKVLSLWDVQEATNSKALAGLTNLEKITVTGFNNEEGNEPFDLNAAAGWGKVKEARLEKAAFINSAGMKAMVGLISLEFDEANLESEQPLDLSFLGSLGKLETLTINESKVSNFESAAALTALRYVYITKVEGITSLAPLKKLPNLKRVTVSADAFPDTELAGFADTVDINKE